MEGALQCSCKCGKVLSFLERWLFCTPSAPLRQCLLQNFFGAYCTPAIHGTDTVVSTMDRAPSSQSIKVSAHQQIAQ